MKIWAKLPNNGSVEFSFKQVLWVLPSSSTSTTWAISSMLIGTKSPLESLTITWSIQLSSSTVVVLHSGLKMDFWQFFPPYLYSISVVARLLKTQKLKNKVFFLIFFLLHSAIASSRPHSGSEDLKKSRPKTLVKSNKSISRKTFLTKLHFFAISKMAKNQFLNWEKV